MEDLKRLIDRLTNEKLLRDEEFIRFTFYEVIIKNKVNSKQQDEFIRLAKNKLTWMDYTVYLEGEEFTYKDALIRVQSNELLVAIKNKGNKSEDTNKAKNILDSLRRKH